MTRPVALKTAPGLRQFLPPPFGPLGRLQKDPLRFLLDYHRQYGDVFRFQVGPFVLHMLAHPDHIKHVLLDHAKNYPRSWVYKRTKLAAGEGLVTTEGQAWRRLRRMAQPAFHPRQIEAMADVMTDATDAMRQRWREVAQRGEPLDVAAEFMELALRIAGRTLLSTDLGGEADRIGPAITASMEYVQYRLENVLALPLGVPTPRNLRFRRALRTLDTILFEIIAQHRHKSERDANDLLTMLMAARDEETGKGLSDVELRDQIFTFIVAGHETTANALTWTFYLLSQHPEAERHVHTEVAEVLGGRTPDADDLQHMVYTRRVIEESLRLYPPVYALLRDARDDDTIGGFRIPARSMVFLSPYVTHRHPEFWPAPEAFDPDRFLPEHTAKRPRFAWYPFLGGPHQCIGQEFAMMETTLVVAMLAQSFSLRLVPGARVEPKPMLSLRPRFGLPMSVHINGSGSVG